jgi:hypothetical protein
MKRLLLATCVCLLGACHTTPPMSESLTTQIRANLKPEHGTMRYSSVAIWLPDSREYRFREVESKVPGVVVLTDSTLLFQGWGGKARTSTLREIRYADIRSATLNVIGRSARIVIETNDGAFDSFAVSDGQGEISMGGPTAEMHKVFLGLLPPSLAAGANMENKR